MNNLMMAWKNFFDTKVRNGSAIVLVLMIAYMFCEVAYQAAGMVGVAVVVFIWGVVVPYGVWIMDGRPGTDC